MNARGFGGLWTYASREFPEHDDFMHIDEERGRIILFTVLFSPPPKYGGMRNWYQPVSDTTIRSRISPKNEWRIHEFLLDGDQLFWTYGGAVHAWRRVPWKNRPDWLDGHIAAAYSRMDDEERQS